jgi:hypothetical protein
MFTACKKFVDIDAPPTRISTESAFSNDQTAAAVLTGVYAQLMSDFSSPSVYGTSFYAEVAADNLSLVDPNNNGGFNNYYRNAIDPNSYTYWEETYKLIYTINISLKELEVTSRLTASVKHRLQGEAYFIRAFCYFYLVNIYGDLPLAVLPDQKVNRMLSRSPVSVIYDQINKDLTAAEGLLDYTYVGADVSQVTTNRLRPNLAAVQALQARSYLYQKRYAEAEVSATKVINQSMLYTLATVRNIFVMNSSETIWALQPVTIGENTKEAIVYLLTNPGIDISLQVYLSDELMNSFELGDERKNFWIETISYDPGTGSKDYPYAAKYKQGPAAGSTAINEYAIVLRLSEQFLIRAEARNEQNNTRGAVEDLNALRAKRRALPTSILENPLPALPVTLSKEALIPLILKERQTELFAEWGHRWFDLKRTGNIDTVMTLVSQARGSVWSNYKALYPIPLGDMLLNKNLTQNPGYQN